MWAKLIVVKIGGAVVLALVLALAAQTIRLNRAQREAYSNALARDSAEAVADTTRAVALREKDREKIFGDSLAAVERRIVQRIIARDALDRATGRSSTTRVSVTGNVAPGAGTATGTVRNEGASGAVGGVAGNPADSVRVADFSDRKEPYTLTARARLPRAGSAIAASLDWTVALDPVRMQYRVQCGEPVRGVRPATVVATGPRWLSLELGTVEQTPEACRNAPDPASQKPWWKPRVMAAVGYGAVWDLSPPAESTKSRWKHGPGGWVGLGYAF